MGPLRLLGAILVLAMLLVAVLGPRLAPYAPDAWDGAPFEAPSRGHLLGTDDLGQDLWSLWLYGARHSFWIALLVASAATVLGTLVGAGAGYRGGVWNFSAMRLVDFALTLPTLPLVLVVAFYVGSRASWLVAVMVFVSWARCAREIQPAAAALREVDSVVAARAMGATESDILLRRIFPMLAPQIFGQFARLTHRAVLLESAVGFLGLGDPRWVSWGGTLYYANARAAFLGESWWWWVLPPGLGIALLVTGFALLGVGEPRGAALRAAAIPVAMPPAPRIPASLLEIRGLTLGYGGQAVLQDVDLEVGEGELVGLAGLSGAGKSTLVQAVLGLLPPGVEIQGGVFWAGDECLRLPERQRRGLRGAEIGWIPQAAMLSLNPLRTVGSQLKEVARFASRQDVAARVDAVLVRVDLAPDLRDAYPHQLSGGMRQRVVIAMVLLRQPRLLLADEATTGLDRDRADEILDLLTRLCREEGMALLSIAHDFATLGRRSDRLAILDQGTIVEAGRADAVFAAPSSAVGRALQAALRPKPMSVEPSPVVNGNAVLELSKVSFSYRRAAVLDEVDLAIRSGEAVGLVGPSGAGKTTLARLALGLLAPTGGSVRLLGQDLATLHRGALRRHRRQAHLIFQDPFAALPWHQRVEQVVGEPLRLGGMESLADRRAQVSLALADAGLSAESFRGRSVDSLSGGERQRVALARALVARPRIILADEPTSMLDAPARRAWLEHLDRLRRKRGLAVLLITHDLEQAQAYCDRVVRLDQGRLVPWQRRSRG